MRRALALALAVTGTPARADGVITRQGRVVAVAPPDDDPGSPETDRLRARSGLAFAELVAEGGATRDGPAGAVALDVVSAVYPFGGFVAGHLGAARTPGRTVVAGALVEVDALFVCRDRAGALHLPILGHSRHACEPGERFGGGGALADVAWDPRTARVAARWGELDAIVNLAGAPATMAYLAGHLDLALGVDAESVWRGSADLRAGSDHVARGVVALRGAVIAAGARLELGARVTYRPALLGTVRALHDAGVIGEAHVLYHQLVGETTIVSAGLVAHAAYWTDPATSTGVLDALGRSTSLFGGLVVELRHESPR